MPWGEAQGSRGVCRANFCRAQSCEMPLWNLPCTILSNGTWVPTNGCDAPVDKRHL